MNINQDTWDVAAVDHLSNANTRPRRSADRNNSISKPSLGPWRPTSVETSSSIHQHPFNHHLPLSPPPSSLVYAAFKHNITTQIDVLKQLRF